MFAGLLRHELREQADPRRRRAELARRRRTGTTSTRRAAARSGTARSAPRRTASSSSPGSACRRSGRPNGVTFEAILEEGTNDVVLQYQDVDHGNSTLNYGSPRRSASRTTSAPPASSSSSSRHCSSRTRGRSRCASRSAAALPRRPTRRRRRARRAWRPPAASSRSRSTGRTTRKLTWPPTASTGGGRRHVGADRLADRQRVHGQRPRRRRDTHVSRDGGRHDRQRERAVLGGVCDGARDCDARAGRVLDPARLAQGRHALEPGRRRRQSARCRRDEVPLELLPRRAAATLTIPSSQLATLRTISFATTATQPEHRHAVDPPLEPPDRRVVDDRRPGHWRDRRPARHAEHAHPSDFVSSTGEMRVSAFGERTSDFLLRTDLISITVGY